MEDVEIWSILDGRGRKFERLFTRDQISEELLRRMLIEVISRGRRSVDFVEKFLKKRKRKNVARFNYENFINPLVLFLISAN